MFFSKCKCFDVFGKICIVISFYDRKFSEKNRICKSKICISLHVNFHFFGLFNERFSFDEIFLQILFLTTTFRLWSVLFVYLHTFTLWLCIFCCLINLRFRLLFIYFVYFFNKSHCIGVSRRGNVYVLTYLHIHMYIRIPFVHITELPLGFISTFISTVFFHFKYPLDFSSVLYMYLHVYLTNKPKQKKLKTI